MPCKPTYEELQKKIKRLEKAESERKRELDALREQLMHQAPLMDASLDGIAIIDQTHSAPLPAPALRSPFRPTALRPYFTNDSA